MDRRVFDDALRYGAATLAADSHHAKQGKLRRIRTKKRDLRGWVFRAKSKFGEGRYFYNVISDARYVGSFVVVIIANSMFCTVPREAFADGGAEFLSEIKKRVQLD